MRWNIPGGSRRNRWHRRRWEQFGSNVVAWLFTLGFVYLAAHVLAIWRQ